MSFFSRWLFVAALCCCASPTLANGRFPLAGQVVFDPGSEQHLLVSTTFGLLESRDGGRSFSYTCEFALGLGGQEDPMLAITAGGVTVAATFNGIVTSRDGCSYTKVPELDGEIIPDLTLSRSEAGTLVAFRSVGLGDGRFDSELVRSEDDGESWTRLAPKLPGELLPITVDVAPSDPERIYLSARLGGADEYSSVLLRSLDGGHTFERSLVPHTSNQRLAFIAAVDPVNADRLYLRVDDPEGTVLLLSEDAGESFSTLFSGTGALLGFAIDPAGESIVFGGPADGLWNGAADGTGIERRSDLGPSCLGWNAQRLYACADETQFGFALGVSADQGQTFEPLVRFADLCGPVACGEETLVGRECVSDWNAIAPVLGATCGVDPGTPSRGGAGAAGAPSVPGSDPKPGRRADSGCAWTASQKGAAKLPACYLLVLLAGAYVARRHYLRHSAGS